MPGIAPELGTSTTAEYALVRPTSESVRFVIAKQALLWKEVKGEEARLAAAEA
jgi:hypothetical protein